MPQDEHHPSHGLPLWARVAVFAAAYFGCAWAGDWLTFKPSDFSAFWPNSGLFVAVLLIHPPRTWPWFLLAAVPANFAFDLMHDRPLWLTAVFTAGNCGEAAVGALLTRRLARGVRLTTLTGLLSLFLGSAVVSTTVSATLGAAGVWAAYGAEPAMTWVRWWTGDLVGVLLAAPLILSWSQPTDGRGIAWRRAAEYAVLLAVLACLSHQAFFNYTDSQGKKFILLPVVMWAALRFGVRGASLASLVAAVVGVAVTITHGGLPGAGVDEHILHGIVVQMFFAFTTAMALVSASAYRERQLLAERMADERERLHVTLRSIRDGVIATDDLGAIATMNRTAEELTGWSLEEARGKPLSEVFHLLSARTRQRIESPVAKVLEAGGATDIASDMFLIRRDGSQVRIAESGATITGSHGDTLGVVLVFRDVSREELQQRLIREQQQMLDLILGNTRMLAAFLDTQFNFVWVNRAYAETCRREPSFFPGKNRFALYPDAESQAIFQRVVDTGEPFFAAAKPFAFPDQPDRGVTYWDWSLVPVKDETGSGAGLVFTLVEVTDTIRREEDLRLKSLVLDQIRDHVTVTDMNGVITYVNRAETETFGLAAERIVGQPTAVFGEDPEHGATQREIVERTVRDGAWRGEVVNYAADGREHVMDCRTQVVFDALGNPVALCGISTDITERKKTLEALRESEAKWRSYVENAPVGVLVADDSGRHIEANRAAEEMLGYGPGELVGTRPRDFTAEESAAAVDRHNATVRATGYAEGQFVLRRKDGRRIWALVRAVKIGGDRFLGLIQDVTERVRADEALRDGEERFRLLVEAAPDAVFVQSEGRFVYLNPAMLALLGATRPEELLGTEFMKRMAPEFREAIRDRIRLQRETGRPAPLMEQEYLRLDGSRVPVETTAVAIRYQGRDAHLVFVRDTSERRRADQELRHSYDRYQQLVDHALDGIFTLDSGGHFLFANDGFCAMLGYAREELLGLNILDTYPDELRDAGRQRLALIRRGEAAQFQRPIKRRDGGLIIIEANAWKTQEGFTQAIVRDITDRRRAEEALRERDRMNQTILDGLPCAAMLLRRGTNEVVACNEAARSVGLCVGETCYSAWWHLRDQCPWCRASELAADNGSLRAEIARDGRTWDAYWVQVTDDLYLHYAFDVTEQKRLEDVALHGEKMRLVGQLAGGIAHDFNNQLASIFGYSDLLAMSLPEGPGREAAEQIAKAARRSADLTRQLLVFARKEVARREPFSVNDLARETASLLERSVDRRIRIVVRAETARAAMGDASLIQTALLNLALNARDAMPHGGTLTIAVADVEVGPGFASARGERPAPGPYIRASVTDTGGGMDAETKRRLFEPFFTTKREKGTGLGLAGVYGAVKAHAGFVDFRSEPGRGSEFSIFLPAAETGAAAPVHQAAAAPLARTATILLVDDEESILRLNTKVLAAEGHKVIACPDGFAALERYRAEGPAIDLVILDMVMPRMSGSEAASAIRLVNPGARILICTGFSDAYEGGIARGAGVTAFLRKPFMPRDLVAKVRELLDQPA